jgi:hypothetical protein
MDLLDRGAKLANILALLPAGYCAYGTWVLLHSSSGTTIPSKPHPIEPPMFNSTGILISLGLFVGCVVLGAVLNVISGKRQKPRTGSPKEGQGTQALWEAHAESELIAVAPSVFVHHIRESDGREKLSFSNERPRAAVNAKLGPLCSAQFYEAEYKLDISPNTLPPIQNAKSVECVLYDFLTQRLADGTSETSDTVLLDYDDSDGHQFSRLFSLTVGITGTVTWSPGPIRKRGTIEIPPPRAQDLEALRDKLKLAAGWQNEHAASEQYARELQIERSARGAAEQRVAELTAKISRLEQGPALAITISSPQGGMRLPFDFDNEDWFHYSVSIQNQDEQKSACDLIVRVEFEDGSQRSAPRVIERSLFIKRRSTGKVEGFSNITNCLLAKDTIDVLLAAWSGAGPVQVVRNWVVEPPAVLSPGGFKHPVGDELYPGTWTCTVTAIGQNINLSRTFAFEISNNAVQHIVRSMPPPG